ncbi:SIMPL domain-containing protein [Massilia antarctica]|uniref:SIMPL domain-containing protein n=1 Tax=Massilia antarctica TaxID=2765360 RepID=A0AA48WID9_9BURK|nr:SIMPL domain-containing protein [Massilia antarctica]QPI52566.1 SIMPL domain-containing protein [Massilia antarctica]
MDSYIEVIGQSSLVEQVTTYRADLSLSVRAAHADTAISEAGALRDDCIRVLKSSGIDPDEMSEGGNAIWQPWFWKKGKPGQERAFKILIACSDAKRLYTALDALQPIFEHQRYTLSVSMLKPQFEASDAERAAAHAAALADARGKAQLIASESGVRLSFVWQVEELGIAVGRSGAYGNEDWGYAMRGGGTGSGGDEEAVYVELESAKRINTIRYRVRFGIVAAETDKPAV